MPPGPTAPRSLAGLLAEFRPCFTAPTFHTFIGLVVGLIAQTRRRTVCGMFTGAGLDRVWHHRPCPGFWNVGAVRHGRNSASRPASEHGAVGPGGIEQSLSGGR